MYGYRTAITLNEKQLLTATSEIIKIRSVRETPQEGMPLVKDLQKH